MNIRKPVDYSELLVVVEQAVCAGVPQMELYRELGRLVSERPEKGAAVAVSEYLQQTHPECSGFSPRNLRRMRDFYRLYEDQPDLMAQAMKLKWTQNVVIMEANLTMEERGWYLQACEQFGWSKGELWKQIELVAHENISLDQGQCLCYTESNEQHLAEEGENMELNGTFMSGERELTEIRNGRLVQTDHPLLPLYLAAGGSLEEWLVSRAIDRHRPNSRILKKILRLTDSSDLAATLRAHAATITDNYWIRTEEEPMLSYQKVRFTEDSFAEVALTGSFISYSKEYTEKQLRGNSPELTNIGSYEKCWRIENGEWWMYKSGSPLERFSELFISALGQKLGFAMAEYRSDQSFVKTRDFTKGILNFEPASALVGDEEDYALNYDRLTALAPELGKQYLDILFMDAVCFNMDRHTQNYGILREQGTGKIVGMAPNFDNNIALVSRGYGTDPCRTNGMLIELFIDLLRDKHLTYAIPDLDIEEIKMLVDQTLPDAEIDRAYVVAMVTERWQRIIQSMEQIQLSGRELSM